MSDWWMPEIKTETRKYMFWFARLFGHPVKHDGETCAYIWCGRWYVMPDKERP